MEPELVQESVALVAAVGPMAFERPLSGRAWPPIPVKQFVVSRLQQLIVVYMVSDDTRDATEGVKRQ